MAKVDAIEPVPVSDLARDIDAYQLEAQKGPIPVSDRGEIAGYFIAADLHEEFLRYTVRSRAFATEDISDEKAEAIAKSRMDPRHDHLNNLLDPE